MGLALPNDRSVMPPIDPIRVIERLPATVRARLSWSRPSFREALAGIRAEPPRAGDLEAAALLLARASADVGAVVLTQLSAAELGGIGNEAIASLRTDAAQFDADTVDTVDWCIALIEGIASALLRMVPADGLAAIAGAPATTDAELRGLLADPVFGPFLRGQALLLAGTPDAGEVLDEPARAARAELVAAAFLDLCRASDALRARGARVDAFPQDTRGQRGERAVRAASVLRETLSPDEVELLGAARLVSLR